jgi:cysteine desulfurase
MFVMEERTYLDYAATTPLDDKVFNAMLPYFSNKFGNPSSIHTWGQQADDAVESARETVVRLMNAERYTVFFTSGGSESDNLAIRGAAHAAKKCRNAYHLLVSPVEHPAVAKTALSLLDEGFEVEWLPVDGFGMVDPNDVAKRIRKDTALVSVIYGNNEIGTINPIGEIGKVCVERGIFFHTDGVQAAAHLRMDFGQNGIGGFSAGAHKFYGPKGVGILLVADRSMIEPVQTGGGQEFGMRAGTHNVPGIVGLGKAYEITCNDMEQNNQHTLLLRDKILTGVTQTIAGTRITGHPTQRLSNHASFIFENVDGNALLMILDAGGFACSSGSACKSGNPKPSNVLIALGIDERSALGSLRVTLGRNTTEEEVQRFLDYLPEAVSKVRKLYAG